MILAATASLALPIAASAGETVEIQLLDKGANVDMATDMGIGMGGDMAKAPMAMVAAPTQVHAGTVEFKVKNASKEVMHEVIVAPVADPSKPLIYNAELQRVDEEAVGDKGEVADLEPGKEGSMKIDLPAGDYILYCNIPGHYMSGMWTALRVVP